jgi:hypothetical protein
MAPAVAFRTNTARNVSAASGDTGIITWIRGVPSPRCVTFGPGSGILFQQWDIVKQCTSVAATVIAATVIAATVIAATVIAATVIAATVIPASLLAALPRI